MCGIVGYIGNKDAVPILLKGLQRLEYRGYDSAGISVMGTGGIQIVKQAGKVSELSKAVDDSPISGTIGIAHTRWATHGEPNNINAHPHTDASETFSLVHNGIIENHTSLRTYLHEKGVSFKTETDTEVLVQLIGYLYQKEEISFEQAVRSALQEVVGAYGIAVTCKDEQETIIVARLGSPLVLGVGDDEYFVASDASPIVEYTRRVVYLDEGEMVCMTPNGYEVKNIKKDILLSKEIKEIDLSVEQIEKGNFPHFMLKEIHEQAQTIPDTLRGRLLVDKGTAHLGGIEDWIPRFEQAHRIYITACGTSWHAGLIGKYLIEEYAQIPVHVEYASEFRYRRNIVDKDTLVLAISQSGETADTLAAIKKAKEKGALTVGICNVVGSSIARETECGIYTHAGPEIGVASTKAFTAQVTVLYMLALRLGKSAGMSAVEGRTLAKALSGIGSDAARVLGQSEEIEKVAWEYKDVDNFLYLGRGLNFPVALEGALKLKEISYIHAEGYPAAEMKHGPIALIDEKMPVVFLAPHDLTFEKVLSNINEVKARKGKIITLTDKKTKELTDLSDHLIVVPSSHPRIFPILATIPLQLLAYHLAVIRGCNVDQPRNLAKSVTVE